MKNITLGFVAQGDTSGLVCWLHWSLYNLKQFPWAWFGQFSMIILEFGMTFSETRHFIFYRHSAPYLFIYLVVYVNDIVINGNDQDGIIKLKRPFFQHFRTKNLANWSSFFSIKVAQFKRYRHLTMEVDFIHSWGVKNDRL